MPQSDASNHPIPIMRPFLDEHEADAARRVILSGWVTQGPEVAAFEEDFAAMVGAPHACAVSNCTTALHLALKAVGVGAGDEVITVSHSYIATANSVRYCAALPVFVDIQPDTFNIDPARIEEAITPRTRAILAVHQMGMPCDLQALLEIAGRHGLRVVEDAACAIGSEIRWAGRWEMIGKPHADIACFSFHPRKLVTTGDGGMLTTANELWNRQFRLWRQHAMSVPDTVRHASKQVVFESYPELGYNYRLTDIQAAVGREQLRKLPAIIQRRRELAARYDALLAKVNGVTPPRQPDWALSNYQSYCVRLNPECDQVEVMQSMLDAGIATRRGIMCAHREPAYPPDVWSCAPNPPRSRWPTGRCPQLRESEAAQDCGILLPLYGELTDEDQDRVVAQLRLACERQARKADPRGVI